MSKNKRTQDEYDPASEIDPETQVDQSTQQAVNESKLACTVATHNAIIDGKRHDHGQEVEGGMTAEQIRQHRRQGVAIVCPDLKDELSEAV